MKFLMDILSNNNFIIKKETTIKFSDIKSNAWYFKYIQTIRNLQTKKCLLKYSV